MTFLKLIVGRDAITKHVQNMEKKNDYGGVEVTFKLKKEVAKPAVVVFEKKDFSAIIGDV